MKLLTADIHTKLRRNAAQAGDHVPVLKLFNPVDAVTWLAIELDEDGDILFGLADLGFGTPELGYFSLSELQSLKLPFRLGIERDIGFRTDKPLSQWAEKARRHGSIMEARQHGYVQP